MSHKLRGFLAALALGVLLLTSSASAAERRHSARSEVKAQVTWSPPTWLQQAWGRLTAFWQAAGGSLDPYGRTTPATPPPPTPDQSGAGGSADPYG